MYPFVHLSLGFLRVLVIRMLRVVILLVVPVKILEITVLLVIKSIIKFIINVSLVIINASGVLEILILNVWNVMEKIEILIIIANVIMGTLKMKKNNAKNALLNAKLVLRRKINVLYVMNCLIEILLPLSANVKKDIVKMINLNALKLVI